jgi:exopolyphosphatase/guanosine-5'-triphosphate,3'-diphosphate pyrophosphatase
MTICPRVPYACIDIGSNTTRLLVADTHRGELRELMARRAFTKLGRGTGPDGLIPDEKIEQTAEVVSAQARLARELGAGRIVVVATAAVRDAANCSQVVRSLEDRAGVEVRVLRSEEEARLAFVGATRTLGAPLEGPVAVVDVGGGSTEICVGTLAGGMDWCESFRIGSGFLADRHLGSDPPAAAELQAVREHVEAAFRGLEVPEAGQAVAVGGSAASLRRLVGAQLEHEAMERAITLLSTASRRELERRLELDPERLKVLPAGILIFAGISDRLGIPLQIGKGGLREGVILEQVADGART